MEWNDLLNQIIQILLPLLATFLTGVFTYLGARVKSAYENKVKTETAKTVVNDVVRFVEQVYSDIGGKEKLQKAIEQASTILASKGISLTETEINMLIESAVFGLNDGLKKEVAEDIAEVQEEVMDSQQILDEKIIHTIPESVEE